ncbi:MAG: hypothetical protein WC707_04985 [Candidatus Babeliaceae bacterium]|jgi:hypothetical protein
MGLRITNLSHFYAAARSILIGIIAFVVVASFFGYMYIRTTFLKNTRIAMNSTLDTTKQRLNHYIQSEMQKVKELTSVSQVIDFLNKKITIVQVQDFLKKNYSKDYHDIIIFDAHNTPLVAFSDNFMMYKDNKALQNSLQRAQILLEPDISDFFLHPIAQQQTLCITAPIFYEQVFLGTIAFAVILNNITVLTHDYAGLGATGEIVVGKKIDDHAVVLFPTRFDQNAGFTYKIALGESHAIPLQKSVNGHKGTGIFLDYKKAKCFFVWEYIPLMEWGIVVKINMREVERPLLMMKIILFTLFILCIMYVIYFLVKKRSYFKFLLRKYHFLPHAGQLCLRIFFIISVIMFNMFLYKYYYSVSRALYTEKLEFKINLQREAQQISRTTYVLEAWAHSLAFDLSNQKIVLNALGERLKKDLVENTSAMSVAVITKNDPAQPWNMYEVTKKNSDLAITQLQNNNLPYWFTEALDHGALWIPPYQDSNTHEMITTYALAYYAVDDKEQRTPLGVIGITCSMQSFIANLQQKNTQYAQPFIVSLDGKVVYNNSHVSITNVDIEVANKNKSSLLLEKIPNMGWYLANVISIKKALFVSALVSLGSNIIISFLIAVITISCLLWVRLSKMYQSKKNNIIKKACLIIATLLLLRAVLLIFGL